MANISYLEMGQGSLLMFQHGLTADARQIFQLLDTLTLTKLVCMDCPGHGLSKWEKPEDIGFDAYADQVVQLMRTLGYDKMMIGGLSMGAGIAMNVALRYPSLCEGLILLRPAWLDRPSPSNLLLLDRAAEYLSQPLGKDQCIASGILDELMAENPAAAQSLLGIFSDHQQEGLSDVIKKMIADRPIASLTELAAICIPSITIANEDDPLHPFDIAAQIHDMLPNNQLCQVVSRYIDPTQHQHEVVTLIGDFIKRQ